jgi:hypothetical protein
VALLEKRRFLYNHSGDFPQVILIVPSHVPNNIPAKKNFICDLFLTLKFKSLNAFQQKATDMKCIAWVGSKEGKRGYGIKK